MKFAIVGAGLIGLTTAYCLTRRGHEVIVLERHSGVGRETSFANGALLTPGMADPWNAPGSWRFLLQSLVRSDSPLQLRWRALPSLLHWGALFLRNSTAAAFDCHTRANLGLALYSLRVMDALRQETGVEYGRSARGILKIFRDRNSLDATAQIASRFSKDGLRFRRLSAVDSVAMEPALAPIGDRLAGAIHYELDETGDAYRFCEGLAQYLLERGVDIRFSTDVSSIELHRDAVTGLVAGRTRVAADRYVIAAGSFSTALLRQVGLRLPVQPASGYSITLQHSHGRSSLSLPIVDDHLHAAVVPMAGAIRVAGTAEFAGFERTIKPERIENLLALLREVLPLETFDTAAGTPWRGLRPMSADGVPIIGATPLSNLFLNTGHGHLGWTLAAGSGQVLADLLTGHSPAVDPTPFDFARFSLTTREVPSHARPYS